MPLMIAEFLKERDMLLRGLAHPLAMGVSVAVLSYQFLGRIRSGWGQVFATTSFHHDKDKTVSDPMDQIPAWCGSLPA